MNRIHVRREIWNPHNEFSLLAGVMFPDGTIATAAPVVLTKHDNTDTMPPSEATFTLDREGATRLMDDLWGAGVRPSSHGTPGQIDAMKNHLEDMRKLVFSPES